MEERVLIIADAKFTCCLCGGNAGSVQLSGPPNSATISRQSFTSAMQARVPREQYGKLWKALASKDAGALYALDLEYAPFFCPLCTACYCGDHWDTWDTWDSGDEESFHWHDSIWGRCPQGHERMLED